MKKLQTIAGKYELGDLLGRGGMGHVFAARSTTTGKNVAIKVVSHGALAIEDDVAVARFEREARAGCAIDSPHVVQVFDADRDPDSGVAYMVMELLEGQSLSQVLKKIGPLAPAAVLSIAAQTCVGLAAAHALGIVHRDIKPGNLFLAERKTGELTVVVLDFGIAKLELDAALSAEGGLTRTGSLLGSPHYMSPEQAMGLKTIDHRTDVWSVGAVMYKGLTGRAPHAQIDAVGQLIVALSTRPVAPVRQLAPWVSPEIAEIVERALRIDPEERYASCEALRDAVLALQGDSRLTPETLTGISEQDRARAASQTADLARAGEAPTEAGVTRPGSGSTRSRSRRTVALSTLALMALVGGLAIWRMNAPVSELATPSPPLHAEPAAAAEPPSTRAARPPPPPASAPAPAASSAPSRVTRTPRPSVAAPSRPPAPSPPPAAATSSDRLEVIRKTEEF